MTNDLIKIFTIFHKPYFTYQNEIFTAIQAGRKISNMRLDMIGDDTGDNISGKNENYNELTAIYWVWKNIRADYIGFCHYRRYFNFNLNDNLEEVFPPTPPEYFDKNYGIMNIEEIFSNRMIKSLLAKHDIILPKKIHLGGRTIEDHYKECHIAEDWDLMIEVVSKKYPEYKSYIQEIFKNNDKLYAFNMFVMKYDIFVSYTEWLFSILFEIEKKISNSQKRVFGFMAERLLNLFIHKNVQDKTRIKELFTLNMFVYLYPFVDVLHPVNFPSTYYTADS